MRLLLDQNISNRIVSKLIQHFPEIKHVKDFGLNESNDSSIWQFAKNKGFTIVSFDSDFYEMILINGFPPKIIWLRTGNIRTNDLANIINSNFEKINNFINSPESVGIGCLEIY